MNTITNTIRGNVRFEEQIMKTRMSAHFERASRKQANDALHRLSTVYHDSLPIFDIDRILGFAGFDPTEPAIYCGREGRSHEQVGPRTWFTMTWHKMESGRYEVIAYVS